jgi:hypothetical protein
LFACGTSLAEHPFDQKKFSNLHSEHHHRGGLLAFHLLLEKDGMKRGSPSIAELLDEADSSIYITLSLALDPPLQVQEEDSPCCTSNEDASVIKHAQRWAQRLRSNYLTLSKRLLPVFAKDSQGFDWLFTRFIKSQDPPFEMDSVYKGAYFVSLIPVQESIPYLRGSKRDLLVSDEVTVRALFTLIQK